MTSFLFVLERTFELYKKNFKQFVPYLLLMLPLLSVQTYVLETYGSSFTYEFISGPDWKFLTAFILGNIVISAMVLLLQIGMINLIAQLHTGQTPTNYKKMLQGSLQRLVPVILGSIALALVSILGFIFFIIPGILFSIWFIFVPVVLALHKVSIVEGFKKSKEVVQGRFFDVVFRLIGYGILLAVLGYVIIGFVSFPLEIIYSVFLKGGNISETAEKLFIFFAFIPSTIIGVMLSPLQQFVQTILFLELKSHPVKTIKAEK